MTRPTTVRWLMMSLGILLAARGIGGLLAVDSTALWANLLGIGGFTEAEMRFGWLGYAMRILYLIESRLWIILAFPLIFRLPWGRDIVLVVAIASMLVQGCRLLLGSGLSAGIWLAIFAGMIALFATAPQIKSYLAAGKA
ncbi:hypothetical protein [Herpetosiphon sp. NSE202]|uniref:hypothetical protein n=1 Tax=Herpetosiphon sp. NSE202 TaxID=3351349 RepID=UPI0036305D65